MFFYKSSPDSSGYPAVSIGSERKRWHEEYERIAGKASKKKCAFQCNQKSLNKNNIRRSQIVSANKCIGTINSNIKWQSVIL